MDVTDVLRGRMHEPAGLQRTVTLSVAAHAMLVTALLVAPDFWPGPRAQTPPTIMTITLGGGNGPSNGGMTAMGGRPVQVQTPPEVKRPEPVRPPAAKTPQITLPKPSATVAKATPAPPVDEVPGATVATTTPAPVVTEAPDEARGQTPTRGAETSTGSAIAETGARGQGFGLSTGGGPGAGSTLDVADFCCPDYLVLMTERIKSAWDQNQGVAGQTIVKFTIQRDGRLTEAVVEKPSGYPPLEFFALRAVLMTKQLPPLPAAFSNPSLTVHLNFNYQR